MKCIEDEIPFDVPDNWEWTRLELITSVITDYVANGSFASLKENVRTYKEPNYAVFVRTIDFSNKFQKDLSYIDKKSYDYLEKSKLFGGELMLSNIGASIGKVFKIPNLNCPMSLAPNAIILRFFDNDTTSYFEYVFKSFVGQEYLLKLTAGAAMPKFNKTDLRAMLVPLPPIDEQKRILLDVQKVFTLIEQIENEKENLLNIISKTKSKILDLAIRGKLAPQDPNDESASVLLERIREEKEELIKQGKIKRDKRESIIFKGEDNSYYQNLPKNWTISSLNTITTSLYLNDGDWILSENMVQSGDVKLIQLGSVGFMKYNDKGFKYLTEEMFTKLSCKQIHSGYLLINRIISDKMCSCLLPQIQGKIITTVDTCWIAPCDKWYCLKYLLYAISSPQFQSLVILNCSGTTRKRISKTNLINLPLAIPPLAEQKRIVKAIETAFTQLDAIAELI